MLIIDLRDVIGPASLYSRLSKCQAKLERPGTVGFRDISTS